MTKNKIMSLVLAAAVAGSVCLGGGATPALAAKKTTQLYASGKGTKTNPWHIRTAKQFSNIRKHLNGNFILDKNISLSSYKDFDPIGSFTGDSKDDEQASAKTAFTGTFDGNGKTISNVSISANGEKGVGLFGAVSGKGVIRDLIVKNVTVQNGGFGTGAVAGYVSGDASIRGISLTGTNKISAATMVGGITGAANNKLIKDCTATADITITGDNSIFAQCAGVLMGGDEGADLVNCHAIGGSVTATGKLANDTGINGLGGMAGCAMGVSKVTDCSATDVTIKANDKAMMIGGVLGFAGLSGGAKTEVSRCVSDAVKIDAPETAERIGGIIGGGFYVTQYKEYYPTPASISVDHCYADADITNGRIIGAIAGYISEDSSIEKCSGSVRFQGKDISDLTGGTPASISVDTLG